MTMRYLPSISKYYFGYFRDLLPDLPETYVEWVTFMAEREMELRQIGEPCMLIDIDYCEFVRFISNAKCPKNFKSLEAYMAGKVGGRQY